MEPHFLTNDKIMFYKYIDKSNVYFEYGSGGSTYQASLRSNISKIYSVESDKTWFNKVEQSIVSNNITYFYNEMNTIQNSWGYPGPDTTDFQKKKYSDYIRLIKNPKTIDLILIDGRFRVACCLKCFDKINQDCFIIFDDFLNRPQYHIVLDYYEIIEKTIDNTMVVLQKKNHIKNIPDELIQKYELNPE
jgi:hypothetical protein